MAWTDDRVEILKTMWGDGKSASQIATELGGVTRNAVIGKVHRLGLSNRPTTTTKATTSPAAKVTKPIAKPKVAKPIPTPEKAKPASVVPHNNLPIPRPRPIITAGKPLPPQRSANEVSAEALANVKKLEETARKLNLMQLTERTCKWPIGDPATEEFWFCGHPVDPGKPYCETHVSVAFQPMSSRQGRRAGGR
ncbi:MAG: GcrA cell cycle regulator [Rhodobacteraceae bacterium]|nr:GcrA cell cycle regulator [Paracoccaceae bacterium]